MEKLEPSYVAGEKVKWSSKLWKTVRHLLKKLNIDIPYDPEVLVLGIATLPPQKNTFSKKNLYTYVQISIIHNNQKVEATKYP